MSDLDSRDLERIANWARALATRNQVAWTDADAGLFVRIMKLMNAAQTQERRDEARQQAHMDASDE